MQGSGAFLCLWEGESGASAHGEAGIGEPVGQDSLGVLAAHGQQLVHREGGGAEDGLEGDGVDALSPQLAQGGQRDAEGSCEPSDADGEGIAALGAGVGDDRAALVGDSQAGEGRDGCGRGGRAAVRRGRRLLGDNRLFRLHRAGDGDLIDDLAVGIGGGDFCARAQLVLDGVEVKLIAALREGLAVGTTGLGGQLEAARQIDIVADDAVAAAVAVFAVTASGVDRTAGDGDTGEAADAVAADFAAVAASGVDRTAGDGDAAAADAVAAVAVFAVAASGFDRTAGNGDVAAVAADAVAAHIAAVAAVGSDRTTAGNGDVAAVAADAVAAVVVFAVAAVGSDRTTAGDGDAAAAPDAVAAVAAAAAAAVGSDRTAGDGEAAAAIDAVCAAAALGRQAVIFVAGDGEAAAAVAVDAVTTGEMVVTIQLNRGIAAAGHAYGGFALFADVDVHILECDLDLIVLIVGLDGHGVGRSGVFVLICDDGVGVHHILIRAL